MADVLVIYRGPSQRIRVSPDQPWHLRGGEPFSISVDAMALLTTRYGQRFDIADPPPPSRRKRASVDPGDPGAVPSDPQPSSPDEPEPETPA